MNRWGEIADINLPRDKVTGKTKGFGFIMYEDQRSTVMAVDNMNGASVLHRTVRVGPFSMSRVIRAEWTRWIIAGSIISRVRRTRKGNISSLMPRHTTLFHPPSKVWPFPSLVDL
jgi:RNA recognition motif-containing protein